MKRFLAASFGATVASILLLGVATAQGATETVLYSFQGNTGEYPTVGLINVNGILYGTTEFGGEGSCESEDGYGCGTVFAVDPATGSETVVYSFENYGVDGSNPNAALVMRGGGKLYGTTALGANERVGGTIFRIDLARGAEKVLFSFDPAQGTGQDPTGTLISVKGTLYGTTEVGGKSGNGNVFAFDPKTKNETELYSFGGGTDGRNPNGDLA
jgi:uncharacterized repeat protein (TIGR03803 family)